MTRTRAYNAIAGLAALAVAVALATHAYGSFFGAGASAAGSGRGVERGTIAVDMRGVAYKNGTRTVAVGSAVVWKNFDDQPHTVTASDHSFDTDLIQKGQSFSRTFTSIGKYTYVCKVHPFMRAAITVVQPYGTP